MRDLYNKWGAKAMSKFVRGMVIISLVLGLVGPVAGAVEDTLCAEVLYTFRDSTQITLYSVDHCECQYSVMPTGFLLVQSHHEEGWHVLWGQGENFCECQSSYILKDLDSQAPNEIIALFQDMGNVWGYAIRLVVDSSSVVKTQILHLPDMNNQSEFDSLPIAKDSIATVTLLRETYDGRTDPTVVYDPKGDSLRVVYPHDDGPYQK